MKDKEQITKYLHSIEKKHNIHILYAAEEGARTWMFQSPLSDFDVRFVYIHPLSWYLTVDAIACKEDIWEKEPPVYENDILLVAEIDTHGYELRKVLNLICESNPSLIDIFRSPIIYVDSPIMSTVKQHARQLLSKKTLAKQYLDSAIGNMKKFILNKRMVNRKKYLYIVRNFMCCLYLKRYNGSNYTEYIPPLAFERIIKDVDRSNDIWILVKRKKTESGHWKKEARMVELEKWIGGLWVEAVDYVDNMKNDVKIPDRDMLSRLFMEIVLKYDTLPRLLDPC